ncbi:iron-sulfur cluster assembly protein 1 [Phtheirospermum japonicum]|uniref:Iron-sulfur cluster assembly protein 1 n=1 Tax=Phtheirospermum japonicum TaxID=374723 RepID=A0A830CC98_9LAMI|nr:iron-sulfur cluster assembly protein 1 [Phtheirospermum japonicum]
MLRHVTNKILGKGMRSPAASALSMYHERVVDHYSNPRNVRSFDKSDPNVGTGLVGAPTCGGVMKLQIKVEEKSGKIIDACFKTFGCGSAITSSSVCMCCDHEWGFN